MLRGSIASMGTLVVLIGLLLLAGCAGGGSAGALQVQSAGPGGVLLPATYSTAVYMPTGENIASFWLSDAPMKDLVEGTVERGQVVHIELLWLPKPGRTPLDPSAVNISVRHVIFVDREVGVYGGAGFARMSGGVGAERLKLVIPQTNLALLDASNGFNDVLAPATMSGAFTANLDPGVTRRLGFATSQMVTNILNRTRWVRADDAQAAWRLDGLPALE